MAKKVAGYYDIRIRPKHRPLFTSVTTFEREKIGAQKIKKRILFQDMLYSLKARAHYFTGFIYLATWLRNLVLLLILRS